VPRVIETIDDMFANSPSETKTETEKAFTLGFLSYLGDVKLMLISVCGALTFTVLLVSANTMAMSVRERVREVGILKTLGYTPEAVLGIMLSESVPSGSGNCRGDHRGDSPRPGHVCQLEEPGGSVVGACRKPSAGGGGGSGELLFPGLERIAAADHDLFAVHGLNHGDSDQLQPAKSNGA
jgi:hypothetical protein